ncbi:MAG: N-acetyltransferase [Methanobrevibacter millerae]|uniref:N-acetyltransferase n=1 Tax=Methanobrevibacter millerae TaxID=230361 RepID=A0A8T3VJ76_9EURY|nr:N-acetyltransferase [Methanobrevibacter millerae]
MIIRLENEDDYLEVENLVRNSFWNIYRPGAWEHYIVNHLRNDSCFIKDLAFVIEKDKRIIGHINYSIGKITFDDGRCEDGVVLGPVSIDKNYQNNGYGSELIKYSLKIAEKKNIPFIFVIGDENYYHRFGFESASKYNLFLNGTDMEDECPFFMIKIIDREKISNEKGIFTNPEVFDVDEKDLDEFDKKFEFKEKKIIEGQLDLREC